jgi:pyruvate/2-oxoglutarate/acetoin dehydrogenase E1 component
MAVPDAGLHGKDIRLMTANGKVAAAELKPLQMAMQEITYREAIVAALREEMRRDPKTLIMGEDIGALGGPFKTCQGLYEEFGASRVRDTPIAETGFVGAALGLALTGYRPIVEIMFADFLGVCFDQIANSIAKHRFMSGGRIKTPIVIRALGGAGLRFGAQHSQTAESWLLSVPGLKIICPSNPEQAYLMLKGAIRDDNPVLVLEHKALLSMKGAAPIGVDDVAMPSGPRVLRPGRHATIVASLAMVGKALAAADRLALEGIEAEVIDIQVLRPLNVAPISDSVRRTNILVTVEEQAPTGGWSSDVVADVVSQAFDFLDAPPARITLPDHPLAYSPHLEDAFIPSPERIAATVKSLL